LIRTVTETGSTNADLLAALRNGERLGEGEWLVADRQTSGRGRQGRDWIDGAGNFMGSTVVWLAPGDPPPASFALAVALAVYEAVLPLPPDPAPLQLKWPNDLTYAGAKLAGILLEREGEALVVGIGVNLAQAPYIEGRATVALSQLVPTPDLTVAPPGEAVLSGSFDGLTEDGALRLRTIDGAIRVIHAGDVFFA